MRVVLSRKGFDSGFGGGPSPILPDGRLLSLPIPSPGDHLRYSDLRLDDRTYAELLADLGYHQLAGQICHLDPDLYTGVRPRPPEWRPLFGQIGAAEGHLANQGIGPGDLFLFFGWFRHTVLTADGRLAFDPLDRGGRHVLFGFLQVGEKLALDRSATCPTWMNDHPHAGAGRRERKNNTLYVARQTLSWNDRLPGAGTFAYHPDLVLTRPGGGKSEWALPPLFRDLHITYHSPQSWRDGCFQSAHKGQEFVVEESDQVTAWAKRLLEVGVRLAGSN